MFTEMLMATETLLCICVCDLDIASVYPSAMRALNMSRMTMTFAPLRIEGKDFDDMERYFSNLINIRENCEELCSDFHGLPTYSEMNKYFKGEN